jgi:hypothetical protein
MVDMMGPFLANNAPCCAGDTREPINEWQVRPFAKPAILNRPTAGERWQQKTCDASVHVGLITSADMGRLQKFGGG